MIVYPTQGVRSLMKKWGISTRHLNRLVMGGVVFPTEGKRSYKVENNAYKLFVKVKGNTITVYDIMQVRCVYSYDTAMGFYESVGDDFDDEIPARFRINLRKLRRWPFILLSVRRNNNFWRTVRHI